MELKILKEGIVGDGWGFEGMSKLTTDKLAPSKY
jgi:hypothetical protein